MTYIKTMGEHDGKWLVMSGVKAGDRILTSGLQKVIPGSPVRVVESAVTEKAPQKKQGLFQRAYGKIKRMFKKGK